MDPELLSDLIIEAREHLETIEPNLLELEKTPGNLSLLDQIFRPMHSLKGASGFLGLSKMNGLTHRAENILDALRKGVMAVTPDIMDIVLATTDALRLMLDNLEADSTEGDVDTESLIQAIDALMADETSRAPSPDAARQPAQAGMGPAEPLGPEAPGFRKTGDAAAWIGAREARPAYTLTSFGEGHLMDFIEEARDTIASLSDGLLELEKHPEDPKDLVNDLFRYFHNLKGNSGIIGYHELNDLAHEVETLLNSLRRGERAATQPVIDLLLFVVDVLEALISRIDVVSGVVTPFAIDEILQKLREAVAGGPPALPDDLPNDSPDDSLGDSPDDLSGAAPQTGAPAETGSEETGPDFAAAPESAGGQKNEDVALYRDAVRQQFDLITAAIKGMRTDGSNREYADAMFRSLTTIQNSSDFMALDHIKEYARRTAGIVDQARNTGMDFSILVDLLDQECAIIRDLIASALAAPDVAPDVAPDAAPAAPEETPDATPDGSAPQSASAFANETAGEDEKDEQQGAGAPAVDTHLAQPLAAPKAPSPEAAKEAPAPESAPKTVATPIPEAKAGPAAAGGGVEHKASSTIRVDHEKLDHLMNLIGELIINRNRYAMLARQLESSGNSAEVSLIAQNLTETTYSMVRISDDLQDTIMKVRMVPVASVFSRFPRLVRDISRKSGKEVDLIAEGEDTELDKSVAEVIGDPLVHLIRNSVDHGIEPESVRKNRGKPLKGSVWLRAFYKGNSVAIEVEDDGKGIDPNAMREVAIRRGIISPEEARALDDREAVELIFSPGFSSAEVVTDISGRGVGMDVVRTNIKNLKGSISISSEVGKGTRFSLSLPLTLAIIDALMVTVDNETFAIPLNAVSETTKIESTRLTDVKGRKAVTLRGEVLGIVSMAEFLGLTCRMSEQAILNVVVINDNGRRLGLVVDRMLDRQEVVIKPLGAYLGNIMGISGATIMGDGSVILILDPHELYILATSRAG